MGANVAEGPGARCARCGTEARQVAWGADGSHYIHAAILGVDGDGVTILCGGPLTDEGEPLRPGQVVPCVSVTPSWTVHLVRLGRLGSRRNGAWIGTAACGATPGGSARWVPAKHLAGGPDACKACLDLEKAGLVE